MEPSLAKEGRGGSKKTALQGGYIPCPFGKGEGSRAWEWVKDPPAGEGQVGQKHLFGKGGTGRIEKRGYILSSLTFLPTGAEVFFTSFFS